MSKIYIVEGATGEYEDRRDWIVAAYHNEELAKEHTDKANVRTKELGIHRDNERQQVREHYYDNIEETCAQNEWDPKMICDFTGTRYYYYSVTVSRSIQGALRNTKKEQEELDR